MKKSQELGIKTHPARFPEAVPRFFIELLTKPNEIVIDPFAGSNTTGATAEGLTRRWLASDINKDYVLASGVRFQREPQGDVSSLSAMGAAPAEEHEFEQRVEREAARRIPPVGK